MNKTFRTHIYCSNCLGRENDFLNVVASIEQNCTTLCSIYIHIQYPLPSTSRAIRNNSNIPTSSSFTLQHSPTTSNSPRGSDKILQYFCQLYKLKYIPKLPISQQNFKNAGRKVSLDHSQMVLKSRVNSA